MKFAICIDKVNEAYHFLLLMRVAELPEEGDAVPARLQGEAAFRFAFSAFLGATRTVLYYLQEEGADLSGFTRWYVSARERLLKDSVGAFFTDRREFRLVFAEAVSMTALAPPASTQHQIQPIPRSLLPNVHAELGPSKVSFFDKPGYPASELCARYLENLTSLVDQAQRLAGGALGG